MLIRAIFISMGNIREMTMDLQEDWTTTIYSPKEFSRMKSDELVASELPIIFKLIGEFFFIS